MYRIGSRKIDLQPIVSFGDLDSNHGTVVERIFEASYAIGKLRNRSASFCFRGLLNEVHIGHDDIATVFCDQAQQLLFPSPIGSDLSRDVGEILVRRPGRVGRCKKNLSKCFEATGTVFRNQAEVVNQDTFFSKAIRIGRHRSRSLTTNFAVMRSACHPKSRPRIGVVHKHRRDNGHVWQMRTAGVRIVGHENTAGFDFTVARNHLANRFAHRPKVHWDVWRVDHQVTRSGKQGAAKIQSFLDVHADRSLLQRDSHPRGDGAEMLVENFKRDRVGLTEAIRNIRTVRCGNLFRRFGGVWFYQNRSVRKRFGHPARIDHGC